MKDKKKRIEDISKACLNCGHSNYRVALCCKDPYYVSDLIKDKQKRDLIKKDYRALYRIQKIVNMLTKDIKYLTDDQKTRTLEILKENSEIAIDYFNNPLEEN